MEKELKRHSLCLNHEDTCPYISIQEECVIIADDDTNESIRLCGKQFGILKNLIRQGACDVV